MPSIHLPYVNIALDAFALIVTLIVFIACVQEYSNKKIGSKKFLIFQISVIVALVAAMVGWLGEGHPSLWVMTSVANTVMACACRIAILGFMAYLVESLYSNSRAAFCIFVVFKVLCVLSILFCIGNAFFGYVFYVNETGHYEHTDNYTMGFVYLLYPILAFFAITLMAFLAKSSAKVNRFTFFVYTLFPVAGVIIDYTFHGISLTCVGFAISILVIYTNIYLTRQKQIQAQKNALMLSQINPHFVYNTLSTIASMCDISPKQAKNLTIDFSKYLRSNINSLSSDGLISFDQEMDHVECYLKIEKARFRERLNIIYSVQCKDFKIPPLTVQPLVENAIKHGITKKTGGGTVKICTYEEDANYVIDIIDDGVGFDTESSEEHVGLNNVRTRVEDMCRGELSIKSTIGVGSRVTIKMPKKFQKRGKW